MFLCFLLTESATFAISAGAGFQLSTAILVVIQIYTNITVYWQRLHKATCMSYPNKICFESWQTLSWNCVCVIFSVVHKILFPAFWLVFCLQQPRTCLRQQWKWWRRRRWLWGWRRLRRRWGKRKSGWRRWVWRKGEDGSQVLNLKREELLLRSFLRILCFGVLLILGNISSFLCLKKFFPYFPTFFVMVVWLFCWRRFEFRKPIVLTSSTWVYLLVALWIHAFSSLCHSVAEGYSCDVSLGIHLPIIFFGRMVSCMNGCLMCKRNLWLRPVFGVQMQNANNLRTCGRPSGKFLEMSQGICPMVSHIFSNCLKF